MTDLANDLLRGAGAIAEEVLGSSSQKNRRRTADRCRPVGPYLDSRRYRSGRVSPSAENVPKFSEKATS